MVINFVLQFLDRDKRTLLIEKIFKGLNPGGGLLISEKVHFQSDRESKKLMANLNFATYLFIK